MEPEVHQRVGDTTDQLPRIVAARRQIHALLAVLAAGSLGIALVLVVRPPVSGDVVDGDTLAAIDAEAQRLPKILDASTKSAHAQAEVMASGSQIRAGVMTDAATVRDLVTSEIQLPRNLNQTLELIQHDGAERHVLLTMPDGSPPIGAIARGETRFALDGRSDLAVVVSVPISPLDASSKLTGELVISTPLDFTITREALAPHATRVALSSGSGWTLAIAQSSGAPGPERKLPLVLDPMWKLPPLILDVVPRATAAAASWVGAVRMLTAGIGLAAVVVLGLSLYRNRAP
jgi:hypothetical protein